ncbi:2035_t:CDS:2 [Gigaspora margarita]|uniref:2035_t:CDS:1 n=1 Tax=Gigaspora margarita TaxID=4874 RepID=A0ABM8W1V9_GIGMA|nr:2035_t:CDS:2 [Gigaspora margarita]
MRDTLLSNCGERFFDKTSNCITSTTLELTCIIERQLKKDQKNCSQNGICIDYVNEQNEKFVMCTNINNVKTWTNEADIFSICSPLALYSTAIGKDIILGMTTYSTNNVPVLVDLLHTVQDNGTFGTDEIEFQQQSYSKIIKIYTGTQIEYCFASNNRDLVTAYGAALVDLQSLASSL